MDYKFSLKSILNNLGIKLDPKLSYVPHLKFVKKRITVKFSTINKIKRLKLKNSENHDINFLILDASFNLFILNAAKSFFCPSGKPTELSADKKYILLLLTEDQQIQIQGMKALFMILLNNPFEFNQCLSKNSLNKYVN
ncbi:hypothetical protein BpHYR1_050258 [Brachionus plicatilis]|uniref:Uncharacterized protein n=1 Tax=Brachionus plicatilis TaxID=10195 RepID=A0A3M7RVL9_BRAPC|nr:hypothetical protein BpHYR1_050258 [Brachionus plicatilis]